MTVLIPTLYLQGSSRVPDLESSHGNPFEDRASVDSFVVADDLAAWWHQEICNHNGMWQVGIIMIMGVVTISRIVDFSSGIPSEFAKYTLVPWTPFIFDWLAVATSIRYERNIKQLIRVLIFLKNWKITEKIGLATAILIVSRKFMIWYCSVSGYISVHQKHLTIIVCLMKSISLDPPGHAH